MTTLFGDAINFRPSDEVLITAFPEGLDVRYRMVRLDGSLVGETLVDAPQTEASWWSYAADGQTGYLIRDESSGTGHPGRTVCMT